MSIKKMFSNACVITPNKAIAAGATIELANTASLMLAPHLISTPLHAALYPTGFIILMIGVFGRIEHSEQKKNKAYWGAQSTPTTSPE